MRHAPGGREIVSRKRKIGFGESVSALKVEDGARAEWRGLRCETSTNTLFSDARLPAGP